MTHMPKFLQHTAETIGALHINPEAELLKELCQERLTNLLPSLNLAAPASTYEARLASELEIINAKNYSPYFLIVADYVQWAKDKQIAVGPGRGSGPCSLVGFVLGITNIDPIKYDLPFERFVNPERNTLPDFDVDFCDVRRHEVTSYLQSKYGEDKVAQISSANTTPLPSRLIICDRPLDALVSLYPNPESGFPTAKLNLSEIADAGLVQFNAINRKALTIIQRSVEAIVKSGTPIDIHTIPLDNAATYRRLSAGEHSNINELDDYHYTKTLQEVKPSRFEELYAVVALCQPHQHQYIEKYVECKKSQQPIQHAHPALQSITSDSYGLMLYQEQFMHIVNKLAGFTFAQADTYRRALKRPNKVDISQQNHAFINGAVNNGLSEQGATAILEYISEWSLHSFTKAHAVAYASLIYQAAWLSEHYPTEYANAKSSL